MAFISKAFFWDNKKSINKHIGDSMLAFGLGIAVFFWFFNVLIRFLDSPDLGIGLLLIGTEFQFYEKLFGSTLFILFGSHVQTNIKKRRQAEEQMQESREKLGQAIQGNSISTFIIDNNHIITHWNVACERLTGVPASQMVGTKNQWVPFFTSERTMLADSIVKGETSQEVQRHYEEKIQESILIEGAFECEIFSSKLGKNGKWILFTAAPLKDHDNNITGAIETFQDTTERRKTEAQFRQAQKMESVGRLAGGVAHDYNNVLSVILGYTELAMTQIKPAEKVHTYLNEIHTATKRGGSITKQLLAFARKQTIRPKVIDLNHSVDTMLKMLRRLIGEDINLTWSPGNTSQYVKIDPTQVDQILANLCVNARDAIDNIGEIVIETETKEFDKAYCMNHSGFIPGEFVMMSVSDNGCGMDKNTLDKIFEPFFTTKPAEKGTGLGMATVYGIIKQNNGFINIDSRTGIGSTIKIYLPLNKDKTIKDQSKDTNLIPLGSGEMILLVEDDMDMLNVTAENLKELGYKVMAAKSPEQALRQAKECTCKIHLLISDVIMPKINGIELAKRLQLLYPDFPCLFMSGYTDETIRPLGVFDEGVHFIQKPFSTQTFAKKIRKLLDDS